MLKTYFLPIGLVLALFIALFLPELGIWLSDQNLTSYFIAALFFMNGYDFVVKDLKFNAKLFCHIMVVSCISLFLAPLIVNFQAPLFSLEQSWSLGLFIIACVPTTLSSGIVISTQAGGNRSLAVVLTMVMSFLGVFSLPFCLSLLLANSSDIQIDRLEMMMSLCWKILFPFVLGCLCFKLAKSDHKFGNMLPSSIVILIVYYSTSKSQALIMNSEMFDILIAVAVSLILHILLIVIIFCYAKLIRLKQDNMLALVLCGSQKTLPISVAVLASMSVETGHALVLCICFHFTQLFLDSFFGLHLKKLG